MTYDRYFQRRRGRMAREHLRSTKVAASAIALTLGLLALTPSPANATVTTVPITARVGLGPGGTQLAPGTSWDPLLDTTGRYVFFSTAQALVAADTNGKADVYRRDRLAQRTELVSLFGTSSPIPYDTQVCGVSPTGRYLGFQTKGASAPTAYKEQVWLRDLVDRTTVLVSQESGTAANSGATIGGACPISSDGTRVAFASKATNLTCTANGFAQVYVRKVAAGVTLCMSQSTGGATGNQDSSGPSLSSSGDVVTFMSGASNIVANDSNNKLDIFTRTLSTNTTERVSTDGAGLQANGDSQVPSISATGRYVAFSSTATNLVADDTNATSDVFRKDRQTGTVERVSVSATGVEGNDYSTYPSITADGRYVSFASDANNLYPADTNGDTDIFRRDLDLDKTDLASRRSGSISPGNSASWHSSDISDDGRVVAYESTATDLVPGDTNGQRDVFVRDFAVDIAPFGSFAALATQQHLDFGGSAPSPATVNADVAQLTQGLASPDGLIVAQSRSTAWSAKRAPLIRLYWAFFLRAPDLSGMDYWTKQLTNGKTLAEVAAKFAQSSEFQTKYGSKTNEQFVTLIYQNIFERDPDAAGLAYWTGKLDGKTKTRGDVMANFSESSEGKRFLQPQVDTVLVYLGLMRAMPPKATFDAAVAKQRAGGVPEEFAGQVRHLAGYAARVTP